MATCANVYCKKPIPEGEQVCVWENKDGELFIQFLCLPCSKILEGLAIVKDITEEVLGDKERQRPLS